MENARITNTHITRTTKAKVYLSFTPGFLFFLKLVMAIMLITRAPIKDIQS